MCHYTHLTPFEREKILFFLTEGKSITEIAHLMKRKNIVASLSYRPPIEERPASAANRSVRGHWEADTVVGKQGKAWAFYGSSSRRAKTSQIRQRITSNRSTMS